MLLVKISNIITIGLAIFSILFGASNLILPLKLGIEAGEHTYWALSGFLLTSICIPLLGLVGTILFKGDYNSFFRRIGAIPGAIAIGLCILLLGPLRALPFITTTTYCTMGELIGDPSLLIFSALFLILVFLGAWQENKIVDFLGTYISPLLLISLLSIVIKGLFGHHMPTDSDTEPALSTFFWACKTGYRTLDLLSAMFLTSMIMRNLQTNMPPKDKKSVHALALRGLKCGALAFGILAIIYIAFTYIGALQGYGLDESNAVDLFNHISNRVFDTYGSIIFAITVFFACYSTCVALSSITATYLSSLSETYISYTQGLFIIILATFGMIAIGFEDTLPFSRALIEISFPVLIVITICNILYRTIDFQPIKVPALIALGTSIILYVH